MIRLAHFLLFALAGAWTAEALAGPPDHAPAHGWRKKNDPSYVGYAGRHWDRDYGIRSGRCNREEIGTVLGGVIGGAIGNRSVDGEDRVVGTIVGAAIGALIGNQIGRRLDDRDRSCFGHALELGAAGKPVTWVNKATGVSYELTPGQRNRGYGDSCRNFKMRATGAEILTSGTGVACQTDDGVWEISSAERVARR